MIELPRRRIRGPSHRLTRPLPQTGARPRNRWPNWAVGLGGFAVMAAAAGVITAASLDPRYSERAARSPAPRQAPAAAAKPQAAPPQATPTVPQPAATAPPEVASAPKAVEPAAGPALPAPAFPDPSSTAALGPVGAAPIPALSPPTTGAGAPRPPAPDVEPAQSIAALPPADTSPKQPDALADALASGTIALGRNVDPECLAAPLQAVLSDVAAKFGRVTVVSTHQLNTENHSRGSIRHKLHTACKAVDFTTPRDPSEVMTYLRSRPEVAGINSYRPNGLIHIDLNESPRVARGKPR